MNFEDAFEVKIEDAEIAGINTIQDLVNLLHSKRTK
jgi:acyl carrier protein